MPKNGPFAYHLTVIAAAIRRHVRLNIRTRKTRNKNVGPFAGMTGGVGGHLFFYFLYTFQQ